MQLTSALYVSILSQVIEDLQYVGAMNHPGAGKNDIPNRLKRHFFIFNMIVPPEENINAIYGQMVKSKLNRTIFMVRLTTLLYFQVICPPNANSVVKHYGGCYYSRWSSDTPFVQVEMCMTMFVRDGSGCEGSTNKLTYVLLNVYWQYISSTTCVLSRPRHAKVHHAWVLGLR